MQAGDAVSGDDRWMRLALDEACRAGELGEVPVGAVLVKDGAVIATGRNSPVASHDPTAHAEIVALRAAAAARGNYRLDGCTLYVTLEPCAMCAGAALHARLARVVFGASEPKSGAAGSVVDLFSQPLLNHRTQVEGGVLEDECAATLQRFFAGRRAHARRIARPLRDDALRTPEARFEKLADAALDQHDVDDLPSQRGWRMRYVDRGPAAPAADGRAVLCLHAPGQWSHFFRHLVRQPGPRWLAPDLIGFGRSDKPKRADVHSLAWHAEVLVEWLDGLAIDTIVIAAAPGARPLAALLHTMAPGRVRGILDVDADAGDGVDASQAWEAPFPDRGHAAALRALGGAGLRSDGPSPAQSARIARDAMGYFTP